MPQPTTQHKDKYLMKLILAIAFSIALLTGCEDSGAIKDKRNQRARITSDSESRQHDRQRENERKESEHKWDQAAAPFRFLRETGLLR